ncbi:MAG: cbb3-type cytochrome c oxidase subunit I [Candidatus Delongbacteria bacterium]
MDRDTKSFILASLVWLLLGVSLGVAMTLQLGNYALLRFAHLHLLLLGFMAMMVYGVGYFILPRFNGTTLRWPRLVGAHFWISNLGLLGLVFGALEFRPLFAVISALGVLLFVLNLGATLLGAAPLGERLAAKEAALAKAPLPSKASTPPAAPSTVSTPHATLTGHETIGEVLARHPQLEETIRLFFGDGCFSCPGQSTESVIQAAAVHDIDPELLLGELRKRL